METIISFENAGTQINWINVFLQNPAAERDFFSPHQALKRLFKAQ